MLQLKGISQMARGWERSAPSPFAYSLQTQAYCHRLAKSPTGPQVQSLQHQPRAQWEQAGVYKEVQAGRLGEAERLGAKAVSQGNAQFHPKLAALAPGQVCTGDIQSCSVGNAGMSSSPINADR